MRDNFSWRPISALLYAVLVPNQRAPEEKAVSEPRWFAMTAMLSAGLLYAALPNYLSLGPDWLLLLLMLVVVISAFISHRAGQHRIDKLLGYAASTILTIALVWSLSLLIDAISKHNIEPKTLLRSAGALWVTNILVFALWYWRLDAGGPHARDKLLSHKEGAFLFPQMNFEGPTRRNWTPHFVDYLFLAFNTSTALSPTDTAALSRWGKVLMMVQASISLTILVLLAARAVNIL
jgi:hypothetical protein